MVPPKRRKLSADDAESSNSAESAKSGIHHVITDNKEVDSDNEKLSINTFSPKSNAFLDDNFGEVQGPPLGATPDKDLSKRQKNKGTGEEESLKPTRISERLSIKRNRLGDAEDEWPSLNQTPTRKVKAPPPAATKSQQKKTVPSVKKLNRRPGTPWSIRDKELFFIYLGEYGKNLEAISKRISYSAKVRNLPQKDKVQVRYFYYRCWAKISKFIHLQEIYDVPPVTQELYGLINYGVLRKWVKETDPEFRKCLNELIYFGETTYISKNGKNKRHVKVKTPKCTYLKKINRIEEMTLLEGSATSIIPTQVTLELTPKNSSAWAKVQELSQNPRIRFKLSTSRTLESVFRYLGTKWKSSRIRLKETLGGKEEIELNEELTCSFHPSCQITPLTFVPHKLPKIDVAFNSYKENILPFLVKKRKAKVTKEQDKSGEGTSVSIPPPNEPNIKNKPSKEEPADSEDKADGSAFDNSDKNIPETKNTVCQSSSKKPNENVGSVQPKPPLAEVPSISASVPGLPENENALFLDLSKFSQPTSPNSSQKCLSSPLTIITSKSPSTSIENQPAVKLEKEVPPPLPVLSVPPCVLSPTSSSSNVILSPSLQKKRQTKSARRRTLSLDSNPPLPKHICDIYSVSSVATSNDTSPTNSTKSEVAAKKLKKESEKEFERLSSLASSGFTLSNSNNVTLLHLSLMLGRATVVKMEYEWREKIKPMPVVLPAFCKAASQMANVFRRLCNIAELELTGFSQKMLDKSKVPNAHNKKKDVSTMTDPVKHTILSHPNASTIAGRSRTFIAANAPHAIQLNGHDPVFRVPLVPAFHSPELTQEDQEKMKLQEEQAKALMFQEPKTRLLKRRTLTPRNKKQHSYIVQRTLLPKVSSPMITYIPRPGVQSQAIAKVKTDESTVNEPPASDTCVDMLPEVSKIEPIAIDGSNILSLAVQAAQIDEMSAISQDAFPDSNQNIDIPVPLQSAPVSSGSVSMSPPVSHLLSSTSSVMAVSTITSQSDISLLSDFDISLVSTNASNMGPDAGDKFLDSVLQNSQQGFSGLINSTKKSQEFVSDGSSQLPTISVDTELSHFDASVLQTPPHPSSSSYHPPTSSLEFHSPMHLSMGEQPWMSTDSADISLSSILGESSSFHGNKPKLKTPTKLSSMSTLSHSAFFDSSSSDAVDSSVVSLSKPLFVSDVSLSCLLNDSNLGAPKNVESQNSNPSDTLTVSKQGHAENILFSSSVASDGPPSTLFSEASQDSYAKLDSDVTFQGMVSESSMDLVSKFETLAAHITDHQDQDSSSKLSTPIKKECDVDESDQSRKVDAFVSLSMKNI